MSRQALPDQPAKQLLHLVIGGELTDLSGTEFKDLDKVKMVGVYPNYATAYVAWKAKAQATVEKLSARMQLLGLDHNKEAPAGGGESTSVHMDE